MPKHREQKAARAIPLTRTERKAAEIDQSVKRTQETSRAADLQKIARLKALRLGTATAAADEPSGGAGGDVASTFLEHGKDTA